MSDCQQQCQQNEQSPFILTHWTGKSMSLRETCPCVRRAHNCCVRRAQNCCGIKSFNGISNGDININPAQIRCHSKRPNTITKMNDKINMDSTTAELVNDCN